MMVPYLHEISSAIALTLLAIYGNDINRIVKNRIKTHNIFVRTLAFIALCSLGYSLLTLLTIELIEQALTYFGKTMLAPITILFYVVIGILASRKNQI